MRSVNLIQVALLTLLLTISSASAQHSVNIALSLPKVTIPAAFFDHRATELVQRGHVVDPVSMQSSIDEYIDSLYSLADAIENGIDNNPDIAIDVELVAKTIVTQTNGLLYNNVIAEDISIEQDQINETITCRNKEFDIEYFYFPPGIPTSINEGNAGILFDRIPSGIDLPIGTSYTQGTYIWPFKELYPFRDKIYHADTPEIILIHDKSGDYLIKINGSLSITIPPEKQTENDIQRYLETVVSAYKARCYEAVLLNNACFTINQSAFRSLSNMIEYSTNKTSISEEDIGNNQESMIASYSMNDSTFLITPNMLRNYYNSKLLRTALSGETKLYSNLKGLVFDELAYSDAISRGLTNEISFQAEYDNYRIRTILHYYDLFMLSQIVPSDDEILQEYSSHLPELTEAASCNVSILHFNEHSDAMRVALTMHPEILSNIEYSRIFGTSGLHTNRE